jgi:hypothetical protein
MELNVHITPTGGEPPEDHICYRYIVGSLIYLGVIRPDISCSIHILSQFVSALTHIYYSHLFRVLCYLRETSTCRLFFHVLALSSSRHIVMLPRLVIHLTVVLFLPIVFFLVVPLLLGRLRSR